MEPIQTSADGRPILITERLRLIPFQPSDAPEVQRLAGHPLISATTATIPHPYPDGAAEEWIAKHSNWFREGAGVQCAIVLKDNQLLLGCVDLFGISKVHMKGEIGYWIGVEHWNQGYCTEAAAKLCEYGFNGLGLNKIIARHAAHNPSSGRVLEKIGMRKVGILEKDFFKDGKFSDIVLYEMLRPSP